MYNSACKYKRIQNSVVFHAHHVLVEINIDPLGEVSVIVICVHLFVRGQSPFSGWRYTCVPLPGASAVSDRPIIIMVIGPLVPSIIGNRGTFSHKGLGLGKGSDNAIAPPSPWVMDIL